MKHRRTKEPTYESIDKKQKRWLDAAAGTTTIRLVPEKVRFSEEEAKEKGEGVEAEKHGEGAAEDSKLADPDEDGATARRRWARWRWAWRRWSSRGAASA